MGNNNKKSKRDGLPKICKPSSAKRQAYRNHIEEELQDYEEYIEWDDTATSKKDTQKT